MGVEKNSSDTRLSKTNSLDIYRPPALRNHSAEVVGDTKSGSTNATVKLDATPSTSPSAGEKTTLPVLSTSTSISCNNSPIHTANENKHFDNSVTSTGLKTKELATTDSVAEARATDTLTTTANGHQRQPPATRRERRPDRAVYVPRARRSQTTPPITATTVDAPVTTVSVTASTTPICNNAGNNRQQLPITSISTTSVPTAPSSKLDEVNGRGSSKKVTKLAGNRERRERVKKSNDLTQTSNITKQTEKSKSKTENTVMLIASSNCEFEEASPEKKIIVVSAPAGVNKKLRHSIKSVPSESESDSVHVPVDIVLVNDMNTIKGGDKQTSIAAVQMPNLRIEDVAPNECVNNAIKCDIEEQEFQRASKEINRSNRRIIKQTFVSDILEIPDKIDQNLNGSGCSTVQTRITGLPPKLSSAHSGVDSTTEEEEDDWETLYDESGECLDPKIMQELTSSVGKVKIELPKMDYTAYLTKQSLLNEEEFPHVLEVSNFPVEFKNQDLLMVFSQYKESGFDIKWVDDTHALAVFSSSRIAAEVLTMGHPFVVLKPLAEATVESRLKAKKCAASLQPYRQRPETCAALARRLVTGALGVRLKTDAAERENEKRVLREAKERKLLAAKQRDEAWES